MSDVLARGRLEDQPFPALAGRIFREGRTGGLTLESDGRRRTVWFLGGNPVAVESEDPGDHLARFLLEHGRIGEHEYARVASLPETRDGIARADFLAKDALNWGVKFRFVNLCYDLFRWEGGDFSFAEGSPPRELFLLKVPAHALIIKGVGHLGRVRLHGLAPDDALLAAGEVLPDQARYLGPAERQLLAACVPGATVAAALAAAGGDPEHSRGLVYALACLGLLSLSPAAAFRAPEEDDRAFALEEPAADAFSAPGTPGLDEGGFAPPPQDAGARATTATDLEAALAAATGSGPFPVDEGHPAGRLRSFDESFSAESIEQTAAPLRRAAGARVAAAARAPRGSRLPRLAGVGIGVAAGCAILGFAAWWWMGGDEAAPPAPTPVRQAAPPPVRPPTVAPSPAPPAPPPAPPPTVTAVTGTAAPPAPPQRPVLTDRYRNGLEVLRAGDIDGAAAIWEDLLALEHRDDFTLLLLTACQQDTVLDIQKAFPARRLFLVPRLVKGRSCFRVCLDTFGSRDAAARALAGLPAEFRAAGAAARPVADVLAKR